MFSIAMQEQEIKYRIKHILFLCCLCIAGSMGICSTLSISIHFHVICFPLWLIRGSRPNIKMRCNKWKSKTELEDESVIMGFLGLSSLHKNPETERGGKAGFFFPFLHLFLSSPSHLLNCEMLQCFTITLTRIGTWKHLHSLCSFLCKT